MNDPKTGSEKTPGFDRHMLEALVCPVTHGALSYDAERQELVSRGAGLGFPIRAGIPIMLVSEARQID
ncbi:MAG: Trm112 family protein [Paracoccus sp. (in: a-proteobacteria)]|nr:Trm112 family protein [Paracoccus sp. (in: a-proteobacteria)]